MKTSNSPDQSMAPSNSLAQVMRRHPLFFFYLLAYAFSWLAWLPFVLSQEGRPLSPFHTTLIWVIIVTISSTLAVFGLTLSAFIMTGITASCVLSSDESYSLSLTGSRPASRHGEARLTAQQQVPRLRSR